MDIIMCHKMGQIAGEANDPVNYLLSVDTNEVKLLAGDLVLRMRVRVRVENGEEWNGEYTSSKCGSFEPKVSAVKLPAIARETAVRMITTSFNRTLV